MAGICEFVELRFYDRTGARKNISLPEAKGITFVEELEGDGNASYTAPFLAQAFGVDPDLLEDGFCRAALVLTPGAAPVEVMGWVLQPTSGVLLGDGADAEVQCTTPGYRGMLSRGVLFPEKGGWDKDSSDTRLFFWGSIDTSAWYDPADWSTPL